MRNCFMILGLMVATSPAPALAQSLSFEVQTPKLDSATIKVSIAADGRITMLATNGSRTAMVQCGAVEWNTWLANMQKQFDGAQPVSGEMVLKTEAKGLGDIRTGTIGFAMYKRASGVTYRLFGTGILGPSMIPPTVNANADSGTWAALIKSFQRVATLSDSLSH